MPRLLFGFLVLVGVFFLLRWWLRLPRAVAKRYLRRAGVTTAIGVLVLLAATGRLPWLVSLVGAAVPVIVRLLPAILQRASRGAHSSGPSPGARSQVESRYLRMSLDLATGEMSGEVLEGQFKGRRLEDLHADELSALLAECRAADRDSADLLEAYLDKIQGESWREREPAGASEQAAPRSPHKMTREEAYQVLGLSVGATEQQIIEAHRRLMQKLHPDRGGSNYLATQINQAKEALLGH